MQTDQFSELSQQQFDLAVIGGGIIGAGIARDASQRGLKVALFEKNDYANGTSSRSTRLIHGGLRYLEMLDFGLVRLDLKERETLLRIAPHLVKPLAFVVPMYARSWFYRTKLRLGMNLYDWLSFDKSLPNHRFLSAKETLQLEPALKAPGLQGAAMYYDGQVNLTERLVMENIIAARQNGAMCYNYARVDSLLKDGKRVVGVKVSSMLDDSTAEVRAKVVINATGAWLDGVEHKLTGSNRQRVRTTKGIHFTAPATVKHAIVLFAADNRLFFVIPWLGYAWVGTTDTDFKDELETTHADNADVNYLLETVRELFPRSDWDTIYFTNAGVRALVRQKDSKNESAVSRKHAIVDHSLEADDRADGLISVVGGKLTAYRGIAEDAVSAALKKLSLQVASRSSQEALPGAKTGGKSWADFSAELVQRGQALGLTREQVQYLADVYGGRASEIIAMVQAEPALGTPLHPAYPVVRAVVRHSVEREQCQSLCDLMMRRTSLFFTPDQGAQAAETASRELAHLLDWDAAHQQLEQARYAREVALTQVWRQKTALSPQLELTAVK